MGRASGGLGPAKITYPDIDAWTRLTGAEPTPNEVRMLMILDNAFLTEVARTMPKTPKD